MHCFTSNLNSHLYIWGDLYILYVRFLSNDQSLSQHRNIARILRIYWYLEIKKLPYYPINQVLYVRIRTSVFLSISHKITSTVLASSDRYMAFNFQQKQKKFELCCISGTSSIYDILVFQFSDVVTWIFACIVTRVLFFFYSDMIK